MAYVDFPALKGSVRIEDVARWLKLPVRDESGVMRGPCPACMNDVRALAITPEKQSYYCHAQRKGGDCIALAAHILGVGMRDAALWIAERAKPAEEAECPPSPLQRILERLDPAHPTVRAIMDEATARRCSIGYDTRGLLRNRIAFPVFEGKELIGFIGYSPEDHTFKVPDSLKAPEQPVS
jgi:hypothetical protein